MSVPNTKEINSKAPDSTASSSWSSFRSRWSRASSNNKDVTAVAGAAEPDSANDAQQSAASLPENAPTTPTSASSSSKWSFRKRWASSTAASSTATAEASPQPPLVLDESISFDQLEEDEELDVELLVPGIISITVRQFAEDTEQKFWWKLNLEKKKMTLAEEEEEKNNANDNEGKGGGEDSDAASPPSQIVVSGFLPQSSLEELQEQMHTTFLQPGDIVESFNCCKCDDMDLTDIHALLDDSGGGLVTLVASRPNGDPGLVQANVVTFHATHMSNVQGEEDDLTTGLSFRNRRTTRRQQQHDNDNLKRGVAVSEKSMDGYFAHSVLECNDQLVAINGMNCLECSTEDAELLLQSKFWGADYVCLLAKRQRTQDEKKWSIRKAAVAATGGSMVAVGAVIMATPLHPVGHAMAIGGVAVLGTEFEAPRRALESARRSFQRVKGKSSKDDDEDEEDVGDNDDEEKPKGKRTSPSNEGESGSDDENNEKKPRKDTSSRSSREKKQGNPTHTNPFDDDVDDSNNNHTPFRQQSTVSSNELSDVSLGTPKNQEENRNHSFDE